MTYLIDANVVSEIRRRRPDRSVLDWLAETASAEQHLSVLTVGELRRGAALLRRRDQRAAASLDSWIDKTVTEHRDRLVPVTIEVAERWARVGVPDPVPPIDGLLAATALVYDWTVVTRNTADFEGIGVRTLDPFTPER
jgi:predicted nucleic acid-binding protein